MSEIRRAFRGAWRLAHADPGGLALFDRSVDGFWRSFRAALVVAPAYAVQLALQFTARPPAAGWARVVAVEAIAYAVGWLAFPVVMHWVCRLLGREEAYVGYIVAYNWSSLVQVLVWMPALLLAYAGLGVLVLLAGQIGLLVYQWFIARTALAIDGLSAAAVAGLDLVLGYAIGSLADSMTY
ncbi:MAG: hypothetical protein IRY94_14100 [Rhodospirillaceae bacterium]|nr:hypothetical protein [Rhodospirillaceae bacterium]